ncbi:MAG: hypothetical protein KKH44_07735 [Bacteroidetes bacterium]|nr:hypothetical protein [Bacteroidota bacterium]
MVLNSLTNEVFKKLEEKGFDELKLTETFAVMHRKNPELEDLIDEIVQITQGRIEANYGKFREAKLNEVRRIMNFMIDNSFELADGNSLVSLIELSNLFSLAQTTDTLDGWNNYERCKNANREC